MRTRGGAHFTSPTQLAPPFDAYLDVAVVGGETDQRVADGQLADVKDTGIPSACGTNYISPGGAVNDGYADTAESVATWENQGITGALLIHFHAHEACHCVFHLFMVTVSSSEICQLDLT